MSNSLHLQHLAGKILSLIATNVCQTSGPKIPASQALSMEVVLSGGLELGSYSSDCWLPVFSVCRHVTQLEHDLFSSQSSVGVNSNVANGRNEESPSKDKNKLNLNSCSIDDDETWYDILKTSINFAKINKNILVSMCIAFFKHHYRVQIPMSPQSLKHTPATKQSLSRIQQKYFALSHISLIIYSRKRVND